MILVRTKRTDSVVLTGWVVLAVLGQSIFSVEVKALEGLAILWLLAGVFLVRQTACLPLLLLTCPVFMCEIQRMWAWVQWLAVILLLVRVLLESRYTLRQWLTILGVGTLVLAFSWPANAGDLLAGLIWFSKRELVHQWFHAEAVWAIFPFREAFDRALVAMLTAALLLNGRYFSSHRIWSALAGCGVMVMGSALSASLLPWQTPHRFLGTTNHGQYVEYLLQGAGTNLSFFAMLLAVGLPLWFVLLKTRWRAVLLGMTGFLFPLFLVQERAFFLVVLVMTAAGISGCLVSLTRRHLRNKALRRWRMSASAWGLAGVLLVVGCLVSGFWYVKMGVRDETSLLRVQLRRDVLLRGRSATPLKSATGTVPATSGVISQTASVSAQTSTLPAQGRTSPVVAGSAAAVAKDDRTVLLLKRIETWLSRYDAVRGPAWTLGIDHMLKHALWRGLGAGTWARFHRSQPRPYREYYSHMHNTYLDLMFEYGIVPMLVIYGLCVVAFFRIVFGYGGVSRLWLLYLLPVAVMGLGQHLLFAFTHLCLLLPAFILVPRALAGVFHSAR